MQFSYLTGRGFVYPEYKPKFQRPFNYNVHKLTVEAQVDPKSKSLTGSAIYEVNSWGTIAFDAVEMTVNSVKLDGRDVKYIYDGRTLLVEAEAGNHELVINYFTTPRKGLFFVEHDGKTYVWTQGESEDNRYWIPLPDSPYVKFPTKLSATVPSPMVAVSNGVLIQQRDLDGYSEWTWSLEKPHSPYLIDLAAGEFEVIREECDGVPLEYYVPTGWGEKAKLTFYRTCDAIRFFESYTGVKYPWPNYKQIAVWGFGGGMENTTATLLTSSTLHDEHAHCPGSRFPCPDSEDFTSDPLIVHELSHQWFGDLVTAKDWSEIWLNESFATLMEALYERHALGEDEFQYALYKHLNAYLSDYKSKYSRPITFNVYADPWELFDSHSYEKGSLVLWQLANYLGEDTFKSVLKRFLSEFSFKPASTEDLQRVAEEESKKTLDWFFYQFVRSAGHPAVAYSWDYDLSEKTLKVSLEQVQGEDSYPSYSLSLDLLISDDEGNRLIKVKTNEKSSSLYFHAERPPKFICLDPDFKCFFERRAKKKLEEAIAQLSAKSLVCRLEAIKALTEDGGNKAIGALAEELKRDAFWGARVEAARALAKINSERALTALLDAIGSEKHPKVRTALAEALGSFRSDDAAKILSSMLSNPSESYYARGKAASSLGKTGGQAFEDELEKALDYGGHNWAITLGALDGLSRIGSDHALELILKYAESDKEELVRAAAVKGLGAFPDNGKVIEKIRDYLNDRSVRVRRAAVSAAEQLMTTKLLGRLEEASERDDDPRVRRAARDVAKKIKEGAQKGVAEAQLREEVEKLKSEQRHLEDQLSKIESAR